MNRLKKVKDIISLMTKRAMHRMRLIRLHQVQDAVYDLLLWVIVVLVIGSAAALIVARTIDEMASGVGLLTIVTFVVLGVGLSFFIIFLKQNTRR